MELDEAAVQWGVDNEPMEEVKRQLELWKKSLQKLQEETEDIEMKVLLWETIFQRKEGQAENKD